MAQREPDDLLKTINQSILIKGLIVAAVIHVVVILGTSFGLYRDWKVYGVKSPSAIKQTKQENKREADEAERKAAAEQRAAERDAAVALAESNKATRASANVPANNPSSNVDDLTGATKEPEIEVLPPKNSFSLQDDFGDL